MSDTRDWTRRSSLFSASAAAWRALAPMAWTRSRTGNSVGPNRSRSVVVARSSARPAMSAARAVARCSRRRSASACWSGVRTVRGIGRLLPGGISDARSFSRPRAGKATNFHDAHPLNTASVCRPCLVTESVLGCVQFKAFQTQRSANSVVLRDQEVAGSNPVSPTRSNLLAEHYLCTSRWSGVRRERGNFDGTCTVEPRRSRTHHASQIRPACVPPPQRPELCRGHP